MGQYDNFHNTKNIEKAQRKLDKLLKKRKPDQYQIDLAKEALSQAKLFESCQIFKSFSGYAPNENIMFSDDNRVMWFVKYLIPYDEISSYSIVENVVQKAQTQTTSKGVITRAIIGGGYRRWRWGCRWSGFGGVEISDHLLQRGRRVFHANLHEER